MLSDLGSRPGSSIITLPRNASSYRQQDARPRQKKLSFFVFVPRFHRRLTLPAAEEAGTAVDSLLSRLYATRRKPLRKATILHHLAPEVVSRHPKRDKWLCRINCLVAWVCGSGIVRKFDVGKAKFVFRTWKFLNDDVRLDVGYV